MSAACALQEQPLRSCHAALDAGITQTACMCSMHVFPCCAGCRDQEVPWQMRGTGTQRVQRMHPREGQVARRCWCVHMTAPSGQSLARCDCDPVAPCAASCTYSRKPLSSISSSSAVGVDPSHSPGVLWFSSGSRVVCMGSVRGSSCPTTPQLMPHCHCRGCSTRMSHVLRHMHEAMCAPHGSVLGCTAPLSTAPLSTAPLSNARLHRTGSAHAQNVLARRMFWRAEIRQPHAPVRDAACSG
jgi:hypothetical protein